MRRRRTGLRACTLVAALEGTGAATAIAGTACANVDAFIETESADLAGRLCAVVEDSVASLAECGLDVPTPVLIEVRTRLESGCLGLYHCGTSRIELLDPDSFARVVSGAGGPFAAVPVARHYDSVVTHELAHAAYDDRNCPFSACPVNQEFIAYAMQIRSLPDADRADFEAAGAVEPSEARSYLSRVMLAMAPDRFAAAAWWHFSRQDDPCGYVGGVVSGRFLLDRELR